MSIARLSKLGAFSLIGLLVAALLIAALGVSKIKFGGPLHEENRELSEFNADINPPPVYLVEAFALANVMAIHPESYEINEIRLRGLEADMFAQADRWAASSMPDNLKQQVATVIATDAKEFWSVVNTKLKPAIQAGNAARVDKSLNHLLASYRRHRAKIDALVKATAAAQDHLAEQSESAVWLTSILLATLALILAGAMAGATRLLSKRVLAPLSQTAETMNKMAAGDLNVVRRASDRDDEIGMMFDAMQVFRKSLEADREREAKQLHVVKTLSGALEKLAAGDLTARITDQFEGTNDALRKALNASVDRLSALMSEVRASAESVHRGSREIRSASDDLAMRNTQQAASLEETAAAMSDVTQLVKKSADNAQIAQSSIAQTHQQASEGGEVVRQAVGAMASIEESARQITQIIDVIDAIAFQTNLLALNAGVEAARAGESSKGFAVVANEVRALAQRSTDAAHNIKQLISTSTQHVEHGVGLVGGTGQLLESIVNQIGSVTAQVEEIADMAVTQATNLEQVNISVGAMDTMTRHNAAMVEETTTASRGLSDEAERLGELVAKFRVSNADDAARFSPASRVTAQHKSAQARSAQARSASPIPTRKAPSARMAVAGNLALKPQAEMRAPNHTAPTDQDWSEF